MEKVNYSGINSVRYHPLDEEENWKVVLVKELNDLQFGKLELEHFSEERIEEIVSFTS